MVRVGLLSIVAVLATAAVVFAIHPWIDLQVALHFFDGTAKRKFPLGDKSAIEIIRQINLSLPAVVLSILIGFMAMQQNRPRARIFIPPRVGLFVIAVFATGPGLLVNGLLKPYWPRPRPGAIAETGGEHAFVPWWDVSGTCTGNCSFVSGEVSSAFTMLAIAAVLPSAFRRGVIVTVLAYGSIVAFIRIAAGGHFLSDVIMAAALTALIVWILHGVFFRWDRSGAVENVCENVVQGLNAFAVMTGRIMQHQLSLVTGGITWSPPTRT